MARFLDAQPYILKNEGFYSFVVGDKGGMTYCGISEVFHPECPIFTFLKSQPQPIAHGTCFPELSEAVDDFYKKEEWDTILGDSITDTATAIYFYDWHVNSGGAVKKVQEVIGVEADGVFGRGSLEALNSRDWLDELSKSRIVYYNEVSLVGDNKIFLKGWLNRESTLLTALKIKFR
jgi:lysozyme family protein